MSDSWKIKIFGKGTTYPFVLIDNWFLPHEEEAVWSEIDFYLRNAFIFKSAGSEEDSVARNPDKTSKAQNKRLFLDDLYKNRGASHIINCSYKQRQPFFKKLLEEKINDAVDNFKFDILLIDEAQDFSEKYWDFFELLFLGNDAQNTIPNYLVDFWPITLFTILQILFLLRLKEIQHHFYVQLVF